MKSGFCKILLLNNLHFMSQLVESAFLQKLHDLHSSETRASDGVRLAPRGMENIVGVRPKQYAMHCDALSKEITLV